MARVVLNSVSLAGDSSPILQSIDLTFDPGSIHLILGRNGSGKSMLLRVSAGLRRPKTGRVSLHTAAGTVTGRSKIMQHTAFAFQHAATQLLESTVIEDLRSCAACQASLDHAIDTMQLQHLLTRDPATLSGGEQRRAALGGVLATRGAVVLMDEPFAGLDYLLELALLQALLAERDRGAAVVVSAHDARDVIAHCDRVTILAGGSVAWTGDASDLDDATLIAAGLRPLASDTAGSVRR